MTATHDLAAELLEFAGIDPAAVTRLVLTLEPRRAVTLEVSMIATGDNNVGTELLRRFDLVERADLDPAALRSVMFAGIELDDADELEQLRRWKAEALEVLGEWERVWEAAGRPGRLGHSKADAVRVELEQQHWREP